MLSAVGLAGRLFCYRLLSALPAGSSVKHCGVTWCSVVCSRLCRPLCSASCRASDAVRHGVGSVGQTERVMTGGGAVEGYSRSPSVCDPAADDSWEYRPVVAELCAEIGPLERIYMVSESEMEQTVALLHQLLHVPRDECLQLLRLSGHKLLTVRPYTLHRLVSTLLEHALSPGCVLQCVTGAVQGVQDESSSAAAAAGDDDDATLADASEVFSLSSRHIAGVLDLLHQRLHCVETSVHQLAARQPALLCRSRHQLRKQLHVLGGFLSSDQSTRVVLRCPRVLLETAATTGAKIDYLNYRMCYGADDIVHSAAMAAPLRLIRRRHMFLERLGVFAPQGLRSIGVNSNPPLTSIVMPSDHEFCSKIARARLFDYQVFCRLFDEEISAQDEERHSGSDSDGGEEEDSDHEDYDDEFSDSAN